MGPYDLKIEIKDKESIQIIFSIFDNLDVLQQINVTSNDYYNDLKISAPLMIGSNDE